MGPEETSAPVENILEGTVEEAIGSGQAQVDRHHMAPTGLAETTAQTAGAGCPSSTNPLPGTSGEALQAGASPSARAFTPQLHKDISLGQA